MIDLVLLTMNKLLTAEKDDWYNKQVLQEDLYLIEAFKKHRIVAGRVSWEDESFDFSSVKTIIIRSTWNYYEQFSKFSRWLEKVEKQTQLINTSDIIYWNINKHYLADLEKAGIDIVPTVFTQDKIKLRSLMLEKNWPEAVIKPIVGAGATDTFRINIDTVDQELFNGLIDKQEMLIQPFMTHIIETGELSLIIINGKFTHAIRKIPKPGDFRVQDDHGGRVLAYVPSPREIEFAEKVVRACPNKLYYARVDIIRDNDNHLRLMELEVIEPELFFRFSPQAAFELAHAIHADFYFNSSKET